MPEWFSIFNDAGDIVSYATDDSQGFDEIPSNRKKHVDGPPQPQEPERERAAPSAEAKQLIELLESSRIAADRALAMILKRMRL